MMNIQAKKTRSDRACRIYAAMARRGTNIKAWAEENGFDRTTVWRALHCNHKGRLSNQIRQMIDDQFLKRKVKNITEA
jgi:gp16 family phage-associated protein